MGVSVHAFLCVCDLEIDKAQYHVQGEDIF